MTIEMQFMADVVLECEHCKGKRFKEIREVSYQGISIDQLLGMTVDDTIALFDQHNEKKLVNKLLPLQQVGLGYITLGQSSATLSGGEAQRIKLASFIGREIHKKSYYLFSTNLQQVCTFMTFVSYWFPLMRSLIRATVFWL